MPQDEGQLGNLLALLAQLEESGLAGVLVEQIGNIGHGAAVVLGDVVVGSILGVGGDLAAADGRVAASSEAAEVLLLLDHGGGGGGCGGLLLLLRMGMVGGGLLVHPRLVSALGRELVVSVDVRRGHHLGRCVLRREV